ncbi:hypothetical protein, partial [Mycolicibacterium holsaticum]|uniref:hypothetical protein n=1 Tax=Mycolicibacterium holsaticum TaxID=152142 RepID=UPI00197C6761
AVSVSRWAMTLGSSIVFSFSPQGVGALGRKLSVAVSKASLDAAPMYRLAYDPDGRAWRDRIRGRI